MASYSNFRAADTRTSAPGQLETSSPGANLDLDPGFRPGVPDFEYRLRWNSPLIDAGDPAPPEECQRDWVRPVRGRRDIGAYEYGFRHPDRGGGAP